MYDVIVIGAGINGLAAGLNLADAGLQTLIVESGSRVGGQATTEEPLLPGFLVHPHANYLSYQDLLAKQSTPAARAMAAPSVTPIAQHGLCFRDGRPPLIVYRRDLRQQTRKSFSAYSIRDARTFDRCKAVADKLTPTLGKLFFSSPSRESFAGYYSRVSEAFRGIVDPKTLGQSSARTTIDTLFEADEVRTLLYLLYAEFSGDLFEPGGDVGLLGYVFWLLGRRSLPLGGMATVSETLAHAATAAGVDIRFDTEVERVVVEKGAVQGVRLRGGDFIRAATIASSLGHDVHLKNLMEREVLSASERSTLSRLENARAGLLGSYAGCLDEAPRYRSGAHNPDINECAQTFVGLDSTQEVIDHLNELDSGRLPAPCGPIRVNTLWDPGQAPAGHHVAGADCAFPDGLNANDCSGIERTYPAAFASMWREYAPNVGEAILAQRASLSRNVSRRLVLRAGDAQYRGDARGMYFCGSSTHPGGGVHGACGVNFAHVLLSDRAKSALSV